MDKTTFIETTCRRYFAGELPLADAEDVLEGLQIRGAFDLGGYTGYDYARQAWIVVSAA